MTNKLSNYEKIKFLLEMGVYRCVRVELSDGIRIDYYIEEELTLHEIDNLNITSITPIPNPPKLLPVGTRVRVFKEYANPEDYEGEVIEGIIIDVLDDEACYNIDIGSNNWDNIPARAVYPVWED